MKRSIENRITTDLESKIVLLSGPRQVGKTTLTKQLEMNFVYLNYDSEFDRKVISSGLWDRDCELVIFDELHKKKKWKGWIKGIYDTENIPPRIIVTGSARLDTFRKGGDSLAGRHFYYRLHPLDVKELSGIMAPSEALENILQFGGFPEPFFKASASFSRRWRRSHLDVIIREDLLDLGGVRDIKSIEILIELLRNRVGSTSSYASLARDIQVSVPTIKKWLQILENLFVIFPVRPWHKNIARSILKESKYYFYDTAAVTNGDSARLENSVACALLKELHFIEDTEGYKTALHYLRNKEGGEVDFLTLIDNKPRQMVEVKESDDSFSKSLFHFSTFFEEIEGYQIVHNLKKRKMTSSGMRMWSVVDFLEKMPLFPTIT